MSKIGKALYEIHKMDELAERNQWMNTIHPLIKLSVTIFYIIIVVSFNKYDVAGIFAMGLYLAAGYTISDLSMKDACRRLRFVLPLVCFVGLFNPFFDQHQIVLGNWTINAGILSMITLILKGVYSVFASYLLIATTGIEKICYALSILHVPEILLTQIFLLYRYITVLLEEINRTNQAYMLRAPRQKGVQFKAWGSFAGQLLLRSMDRAEVVYQSMILRGYNGKFATSAVRQKFHVKDLIYFLICVSLCILFRNVPVILWLGNRIGGWFI
ncbi:MAG: cobalt ECF transporter T component CbiQ [Lachnospiraceae bacterium]